MANKLFFESFDHPYWSYDKLWNLEYPASSAATPAAGRTGDCLMFSVGQAALQKRFDTSVPKQTLGFAFRLPSSATYFYGGRKYTSICQLMNDGSGAAIGLHLLLVPTSSAASGFTLAARMWTDINTSPVPATQDPAWIYQADGVTPAPGSDSSIVLAKDTWYYIEVEAVFGATSGGELRVYVDGELAINLADIRTTNSYTGGSAFGGFYLGGVSPTDGSNANYWSAWAQGQYDDVYCHYGDSPTRFGDLTVGHKDLTGAGLSSAWAAYPSGTALTNLTDNKAATGISSSVVDDQHNFTIEALGVTPETIHGVQVCAVGQKTDSGARNLALTALSRSYTGELTGTPANGNTVTIGTAGAEKVYTFKTALTSPTAANEVVVGLNAEASLNNLAAAVLGGDGAGTLYGSDTVAHTKISAAVVTAGPKLTVTGNAGENLDTQATTATGGLTWAEATLTENLDEDVSSDLPMSANTKSFIHTFTVDPRTNLAWTEDWVDAAYIGVKCR